MPRPLRIQYPGAWYHVMNRGASRQNIFRDVHDRRDFLVCLASAASRTAVEVHAYVLMGNHYHLLLRTPHGNLDTMMHLLGRNYARYFNDRYDRDGRLCTDRYFPILVDSDRYLLAVSRYIHRNPTAFGITSLGDYFWSSYAAYLGNRRPQEWLHTDFTLTLAGGLRAYESVVESPLPTEIDLVYSSGKPPHVLGPEQFRQAAIAKAAQASQ